jgi:hypothetical protein
MVTAAPARRKMKRLWTYGQMVAELPETNLPVELWDGEIVMSPTPTPSHQTIVLRFARILMEFAFMRSDRIEFACQVRGPSLERAAVGRVPLRGADHMREDLCRCV